MSNIDNLLKPIKNSKHVSIEEAMRILEGIPDAPEGSAGADEAKGSTAPQNVWQPGMKCLIDALPAENGAYKMQDQWIQYFNALKDGRVFASMPDYYPFFKQLKNSIETGDDNAASQAVIQSLRKDFKDRWIVSSTRIQNGINPANSLEGKIIHNYGCKDTSLVNEEIKEIPVYSSAGIAEVVQEQKGLEYLRAYFGTNDSAETIIQLMGFVSGKERSKIKVWTADTDARSQPTDKVAVLSYGGDGFHINGDDLLIDRGRARGVRYE